jgi:hypothetical protein
MGHLQMLSFGKIYHGRIGHLRTREALPGRFGRTYLL